MFFVLLFFVQSNLYGIRNFVLANVFRITINLCAFVTYSQMAWAISQASEAAKEAEVHTQLVHQLALQQSRVTDLESHTEELKRIQHDRRQHIRALRGLLEQNQVQEAMNYLESYEKSMSAAMIPSICDHFVVDALCRRYVNLAKQSDIEVSLNVVLSNDVPIAGNDLAIILGNLWENAITAALDVPTEQRFIHLWIKNQGDQMMIRMENRFVGVIIQKDQHFFSTKQNRNQEEGVGIASVREVARRYEGIADFDYTEDLFIASVLLYHAHQ